MKVESNYVVKITFLKIISVFYQNEKYFFESLLMD